MSFGTAEWTLIVGVATLVVASVTLAVAIFTWAATRQAATAAERANEIAGQLAG